MDKSLVKTSKFLSLLLRHRPETVDLVLDEQGWVSVDELLEKCRVAGRHISRSLLERVVRENDKKRFAFSEDGQFIRASQGHSLEVELDLTPLEPPALLFHGTVNDVLQAIVEAGLRKMRRHHVHLSADIETARKVGSRRGRPIVLTVRAGEMHQTGIDFFRSANGVWLTDHVPPDYIDFP